MRTAVDPHGPGLEAPGNLVHHIDVLGPDAGGETKLALIGPLDDL